MGSLHIDMSTRRETSAGSWGSVCIVEPVIFIIRTVRKDCTHLGCRTARSDTNHDKAYFCSCAGTHGPSSKYLPLIQSLSMTLNFSSDIGSPSE